MFIMKAVKPRYYCNQCQYNYDCIRDAKLHAAEYREVAANTETHGRYYVVIEYIEAGRSREAAA